ncbi:MAG: hypothetical protein JO288_16440 [Hyphomicrobiales bacterium]|nr:hypothetical protein [Hyphomicrobiales bacterium]
MSAEGFGFGAKTPSAHGKRLAALALGIVAGAAALICLSVKPAAALPAYARQTGQPCAACHTAFPELTPFGRRFKIGGYTLGGGDWQGPPLSAMYMAGFTHTESPQDSPPAPGLRTNDNLASQQVSGFVAGRLYGNLGSFIQITGNPVAGTVFLDASDVRYADTFKLFGQDTIWGIDANNTPTVEDPWNTTPAFGWPQISSTIAPAFAPPLTHLESGYGQIVGGAGAYAFWNDMLYADFTLYKGLSVSELYAFNEPSPPTTDAITNVAPYWRLAVEPHWGQHYLMVGTFGMYGQVVPGRQYGYGTDNYLDVGFDSQYQYDGDLYSVTVKLTDILEWQKLNATYALAGSSNLHNTLNSFKANASFVWDHTYSIGFGYFNINGSSDCNIYGSPAAPCLPNGLGAFPNSFNASPFGDGLILDLAYIPFAHGSPQNLGYTTWNVRLGIQFVDYLHLYGGTTNFDGSFIGGTHNAQGNNSVFAYAWFAF